MIQNSSPGIAIGLFVVWLAFLLLGKYQLGIIRKISIAFIIKEFDLMTKANAKLRLRSFYNQIKEEWLLVIDKKVLFVPHKFELWPIPATPKYLEERLPFTVGWVGKVLIESGKDLKDPEIKKIKKYLSERKK